MTVEIWGKGKPDFYTATIPGRPVIVTAEDTQISWLQSTDYIISAQATATDEFYTIPAGYRLSLGGGFISSNMSCINKLRIISTSETVLGDFRFDIRGDMTANSFTGQGIVAGDVMTIYIYNNNTSEGKFTLTLSGVLDKA